ncbi:hypothetical protein ACOHYD_10340 [Desulfobacterota bacterium M19]
MPSPAITRLAHKIHRLGGLLTAAFIIFYCLSGIMLNHRQAFSFFYQRQPESRAIKTVSNQAVRDFIGHYQNIIQRPDTPRVIRLRDGGRRLEFLYGFHGRTTYIINQDTGLMEIIHKRPQPGLAWLANLHKAFKTSNIWIYLSDFLSIILCLATLSILVVMRYRFLDLVFLGLGLFLCLGGMLIA